MGDFIICSGKKAEHPYLMNYENRAIYRMEELCFYMREHLFLVDAQLITRELFAWIGDELGAKQLERDLCDCLRAKKSAAACALLIFEESALYTDAELEEMEEKMAFYAGLQDVERKKLLADHLLAVGLDRKALYLYMDLYSGVQVKKLSAVLLSSVCYNAGRIYAKQYCLREAADLFAKSYKTGRSDESLRAWLIMVDLMPQDERQAYLEANTDVPDPSDEQESKVKEEIEKERPAYFGSGAQRRITNIWKDTDKRRTQLQTWLGDYIHSVTFH